ncbi:Zinc finger BED domain-containing protein DAYSLEEPER [Striga hermonthica]|uniref:Zinc finger BED domain-containing protein DAYSLEEPER n=1 Tax=Striga hermonthica TaxID=68872 RepID=A0A9N7NPW8_STRHE|nr:Zinc finger BED domain-containing protein DAYSLEEPER [Striga hermonthica]
MVLKGNFAKEKFELSPYSFDQELSREELAKMIIMHEYPLKMVEHEGFKDFAKSLNPCFKMVTRNTVKSDCFKIYEKLKESVMHVFEMNESRVAITTDLWTSSHQKRGFMAVTAHYVDNNWKLQSHIIRFIYVPSPHTSEVLCEALTGCILDWNLDRKLSTITVDNCSTNDAMMRLLLEKLSSNSLLCGGKLLHMRCATHILNLVVEDGLRVIGKTIEKVRDSVSCWTATPKRMEKFEESARQLRVELDCKT